MKLSKSELAELLSDTAHPVAAHFEPAPGLAPFSQSTPLTPLSVELLRASSRTLWHKVCAAPRSKKEMRIKMLELLEWLARKHGWDFSLNVLQTYEGQGGTVDGRMHAQFHSSGRSVAVELCFELQEPILLKVWAAYAKGKQVLLLWAGPPMSDTVFAGRLSALFRGQPVGWLRFIQLNKVEST